ncbi:hypothetical protein [Kribbella solani]|uniref:Uncharacterized protein n=1 Tax=Kribbella solani TaxID=236067 RepID=A0A841DU26_9ACTN|nr:hypothetical protein [Kribbella solani]MBB5982092.1 hypothetical protein [Kribbella solani]MDX2969874.1 hypothetical protein [Kribbella solani]MDX2969898.1 hypothetical protein [Kribbella solani]
MIIAIDADSMDLAAADHLLYDLIAAVDQPVVAVTHLVSGDDRPHVAVSLTSTADLAEPIREVVADRNVGLAITRPGATEPELAGPSRLVRGAYVAAVEAALGTKGRVVRWPGHEQGHGVLPAAELRTRCGIDELEGIGGVPVDDETLIDTLDFLRPVRRDGRLVLQVQPAAGDVLIPFELQHQQTCCTDH